MMEIQSLILGNALSDKCLRSFQVHLNVFPQSKQCNKQKQEMPFRKPLHTISIQILILPLKNLYQIGRCLNRAEILDNINQDIK